MTDSILSDQLWQRIGPLLPKPKKSRHVRHAGRKPADARKVMTGILFVLKTGVPWKHLPATSDFPPGHIWSRVSRRSGASAGDRAGSRRRCKATAPTTARRTGAHSGKGGRAGLSQAAHAAWERTRDDQMGGGAFALMASSVQEAEDARGDERDHA